MSSVLNLSSLSPFLPPSHGHSFSNVDQRKVDWEDSRSICQCVQVHIGSDLPARRRPRWFTSLWQSLLRRSSHEDHQVSVFLCPYVWQKNIRENLHACTCVWKGICWARPIWGNASLIYFFSLVFQFSSSSSHYISFSVEVLFFCSLTLSLS
jgi:hypothetical protein